MSKIVQITLSFEQSLEKLIQKKYPNCDRYRILAKSLDARGAPRGRKPKFHYTVEMVEINEDFKAAQQLEKSEQKIDQAPIIIGAGPAGLFCALRLVDQGIPCVLFERGDSAKTRMKKIAKFWRYGDLDTETNVCFGEGGAGLYSDGKLITRVKSPFIKYVMEQFVRFGAVEEVAYLANPHLGSNKIREIISRMTDYLKEKGCEIHYNTRVDQILFEAIQQDENKVIGIKTHDGQVYKSEHVILASGHSAKEMYEHLEQEKVAMKSKDFAIGVRVEHSRRLIDKLQHGKFCERVELGAARYRLSYHNHDSGKGSYSFCMCPGGYVLSSGTDKDGIVTNGMSNSARNSPWSNAALVVSVNVQKDIDLYKDQALNSKGKVSPLAGLHYLEEIERKAYKLSCEMASGKELPAITIGEFLSGKITDIPLPRSSSPSKLFKVDIARVLPSFVIDHLKVALGEFESKIPGFAHPDALLIAPETRTSAPITIIRDNESLESISHSGLYPAGEGAGYAGGITSAAVDGVRVAEAILAN